MNRRLTICAILLMASISALRSEPVGTWSLENNVAFTQDTSPGSSASLVLTCLAKLPGLLIVSESFAFPKLKNGAEVFLSFDGRPWQRSIWRETADQSSFHTIDPTALRELSSARSVDLVIRLREAQVFHGSFKTDGTAIVLARIAAKCERSQPTLEKS